MIDIPPGLNSELLERSFRAFNGEYGFLPDDLPDIFAACSRAALPIFGWEAWLVDHRASFSGPPIPQPGSWCGLIPIVGYKGPAVISGDTDGIHHHDVATDVAARITETQTQIAKAFDDTAIPPEYVPYIRINFTF